MNFEVVNAKNKQGKKIIINLMQLYIYELSFFEDETVNFKLFDNGLYDIGKYTKLYWKENKRHPYILKCNGEIAGFTLVRFNEDGHYEIGEFFVLNKYRKLGAGKYMARQMFDEFHGKWEIRVLLKNKIAQNFWRSVLKEYSDGNFNETMIRNNTRYAFYFEN